MAGHRGPQPILDHVVILVSHTTLLALPERVQDWLIVSPGGTHADGLTSNQLVLFADGTYLELIAFADDADPDKRKSHRWGEQPENTVVDWAYTLPNEEDFSAVQDRVAAAQAAYVYGDLVAGGRARPDGTRLRWAVSAPRRQDQRALRPGLLPFWCVDRTARELRVPYERARSRTEHPCGARGVSSLAVAVPPAEREALAQVYDAMSPRAEAAGCGGLAWHFEVPAGSTGGSHVARFAGEGEAASGVTLTLQGDRRSPASRELLPGLVLHLDRDHR